MSSSNAFQAKSGKATGLAYVPQFVNYELMSGNGEWLKLMKANYTVNGQARDWECSVRKGQAPGGAVNAVSVVAVLINELDPKKVRLGPRIVTLRQFRAPTGGVSIELPAGLLDTLTLPDGTKVAESVEACALRELEEETGFKGEFWKHEPVLNAYTDPGCFSGTIATAWVIVDLSAPANRNPVPKLGSEEFLEVFDIPLTNFSEILKAEVASRPEHRLEARLMMLSEGLTLAQTFAGQVPNNFRAILTELRIKAAAEAATAKR